MSPHEPQAAASDEQVRGVVRWLARCCLEVERGLRPPAHLARFMPPAVAERWQPRESVGRFRGGAVTNADLGPPHLRRLADGDVLASIITRTEGPRWGALSLRLRAAGRRWHLADVQRLLATNHYRTTTHDLPPVEESLVGRMTRVSEDRRGAGAALTAATQRLTELTPGGPDHKAAGDLVRTWGRIVSVLDRELVDLRTRQQTRQAVQRMLRR